MATIIGQGSKSRARDTAGFYFVMAAIMSAIIVAGFTMNLAMGRSTFAVPVVYHINAGMFFGWLALYMAQTWSRASGRIDLHRSLGRLAYL